MSLYVPTDLHAQPVAPFFFEPKTTGWRFRQILEVTPPVRDAIVVAAS